MCWLFVKQLKILNCNSFYINIQGPIRQRMSLINSNIAAVQANDVKDHNLSFPERSLSQICVKLQPGTFGNRI